ncbi:MAG: uroporphyrinogen-III synthase [Actinomycetota bacterium]
MSTPLSGFTVGVTADRRAGEQIKLLTGRGAECVHGSVIRTHPLDSEEALGAATATLIDDPPDAIVLTTGLGVRSWFEAADALQLGDALHELLDVTTLYARGPKARGALLTAGFEVDGQASLGKYADVVKALVERGVHGEHIAVQLDGAGAGDLCTSIEQLGARVTRVPVYRWSLPESTVDAERLVRATVDRRIDAITFTAKPAVENFLEIAALVDLLEDTLDALSSDVVPACVGPVCATAITDAGLPDPLVPDRYRLGAMVHCLGQHFAGRASTITLGGMNVRVQGRLAAIDGEPDAWLTDRERAILEALLERPGVVLSKRDLLRRIWDDGESDEHLVEVTVARLRRRLGPAADGIETVVRRGYRASAI